MIEGVLYKIAVIYKYAFISLAVEKYGCKDKADDHYLKGDIEWFVPVFKPLHESFVDIQVATDLVADCRFAGVDIIDNEHAVEETAELVIEFL